jgi:hypothetical protein
MFRIYNATGNLNFLRYLLRPVHLVLVAVLLCVQVPFMGGSSLAIIVITFLERRFRRNECSYLSVEGRLCHGIRLCEY